MYSRVCSCLRRAGEEVMSPKELATEGETTVSSLTASPRAKRDILSYVFAHKQLRVIRGSRAHLDIFLKFFVFPDTTFYRLGILKYTSTTTCFFSTETSLDH